MTDKCGAGAAQITARYTAIMRAPKIMTTQLRYILTQNSRIFRVNSQSQNIYVHVDTACMFV